jgi:hypothetical protein
MTVEEIKELLEKAKADYDAVGAAGPAAFESVEIWFSELDALYDIIYECEARLDELT